QFAEVTRHGVALVQLGLFDDLPGHLLDLLHELGRPNWPRSICLSRNSQSPVNSGEDNSGISRPRSSVMSEKALAVGASSRPSRSIYFSYINPSIIDARVAGVPSPFWLMAWRNSSSST